ncbi:MAG: AraC family transcriptional regulator [Thermoanaerobaculia bacterium]
MSGRPAGYPAPPEALLSHPGFEPRDDRRSGATPAGASEVERLPLLDVLTSPVPRGEFQSPLDDRHVLCLHLGAPVPVSYRHDRVERNGVRLHGQFCVVPARSTTRWIVSLPARSLLLRLAPAHLAKIAEEMGLAAGVAELAPSIHVRDPQIERIGWMMQAEEQDGHPGGRLFADSLAGTLAVRLLAMQGQRVRGLRGEGPGSTHRRRLSPLRLRRVLEYIEAHLDADLSLAELAREAGYSPSHFKSLFRESVGRPVHRFVLERRVERARALRLAGEMSATEIALETGFSHSSHMARCMRRVLGTAAGSPPPTRPE